MIRSDWERRPADHRPATASPVSDVNVIQVLASENHGIPNHPWLPMVIYSGAFSTAPGIDGIKALYERNRWFRVWDYTVFDYHHFHPAAHEVLSVAKGSASLQLGGESGQHYTVEVGDVLVLPAGFGHKRISSTDDFTVVGAYPEGQEDRRIIRADEAAAAAARSSIAATALPACDPLYGDDSPMLSIWKAAAAMNVQ